MWERAFDPSSPGGERITNDEGRAIFAKTYEAEGYDQNVGRALSIIAFIWALLCGQKGMESRNFLRGITAFVMSRQGSDMDCIESM